MKATPPAFETARLRVWEIVGIPSEIHEHYPRHMYVATLKNEDWPGIVLGCSIWTDIGNHIDWIETIENKRRKGYAKELCIALRERLGSLDCYGVSESGIGLEKSLEAPHA